MKSQKIKTKALELYLDNISILKISEQLKINKDTFYKWQKKGNWIKLKEEAILKSAEKTTNDIITLQSELGRLASEELLTKVKKKKLADKELVSLAKHGLEVIRPRQTTNNLNITSNKDMTINLVEKSVEEIKNSKLNNNSKASGDTKGSGE